MNALLSAHGQATHHNRMTSDADCTRAGWVEYIAFGGAFELHLSVPPGADLDAARLSAFDHDEQEMIAVSGHLFVWEAIEPVPADLLTA